MRKLKNYCAALFAVIIFSSVSTASYASQSINQVQLTVLGTFTMVSISYFDSTGGGEQFCLSTLGNSSLSVVDDLHKQTQQSLMLSALMEAARTGTPVAFSCANGLNSGGITFFSTL